MTEDRRRKYCRGITSEEFIKTGEPTCVPTFVNVDYDLEEKINRLIKDPQPPLEPDDSNEYEIYME